MSITLEQVKKSEEITSYIRKADESLSALGFTEHSFAHVGLVSAQASAILKTLGYDDRTCELAAIAGWLHDIGNVINRIDHAQSGAVMAFRILDKMGASPEETATIITAIGNHDEKTAFPVNPVAAALILADKMDVRANRVREKARRGVRHSRPRELLRQKARGHADGKGDLPDACHRHGGMRSDRVF